MRGTVSTVFEASRTVVPDSVPDPSPLVSVRDLHITFRRAGRSIYAVRGVDLELQRGEILGLVGESGSGKSVMSSALLGLLPRTPRPEVRGQVLVGGVDMVHGSERAHRELRRTKLGAVFQDPMTSLNPTMRIGAQVIESAGSADEAIRLLDAVEIPDPERRMRSYPHELSGGLRQRVMVAMAIAGSPSLVVADEPTTALDVTVQAQILRLLAKLRTDMGLSIVFITHDLAVAAQLADRVAVMYSGNLVELGSTRGVLVAPAHPYSQGLVSSRLTMTMRRDEPIATLPGEPPDPAVMQPGCAFTPRCARATEDCATTAPVLAASIAHPGAVACFHQLDAGAPMAARPVVVPLVSAVDPEASEGPIAPPAPALEVLGVTKAFRLGTGRKKSTLQALAGVDLAVAPGESLAIVGESGCGKSTLLRVMAGLLEPDAGEVVLWPRRQQPQMIFQDAGASLTPWLTVEDLVGERLRGQGISRQERHDAVLDTLRLVGAPVDLASARAAELSGGQRQRVAIARAVIRPPSVLLCDEPTSALDVSLAATVLNMLSALRRRFNMSIVFVTHDLAAARMVADRIAVMNKGQVVEVGDVESVCRHPRSDYTRTLLAAMPQLGPAAQPADSEPRLAAG